ncbi:hypothetical protein BV25DRAFT_1048114 [Artomyces pyxidatus]|uniref:Uncharacterized protein n=1 Tax=Artomyces pyxidatus TaxID=48021 RepID=A0ACB8SUB7_9AGAM|nr:hypothetical protein BV25DRAFT_1048114 [Artomyces pyxidatus]
MLPEVHFRWTLHGFFLVLSLPESSLGVSLGPRMQKCSSCAPGVCLATRRWLRDSECPLLHVLNIALALGALHAFRHSLSSLSRPSGSPHAM